MCVETVRTQGAKEPADTEDIAREGGQVEGGPENDRDNLVGQVCKRHERCVSTSARVTWTCVSSLSYPAVVETRTAEA